MLIIYLSAVKVKGILSQRKSAAQYELYYEWPSRLLQHFELEQFQAHHEGHLVFRSLLIQVSHRTALKDMMDLMDLC